MRHVAFACALTLTLLAAAPGDAFDHSAWDSLLQTYVDDQGRVAYRSLAARDTPTLDAYLAAVAIADTTTMTEQEALAFYINAYNALVFKGVLDGGTGEGFASPAISSPAGKQTSRIWRTT